VLAAAGILLPADHTSAATKYNAFAGGGGRGVAVETFRPSTIFVNLGDTVSFTNPYEEFHTVSFLGGETAPELILAKPNPAGPPTLSFNAKVAAPSPLPPVGVSYDGTKFTNSGFLFKGQSWDVTFSKLGTYPFVCLIHPGMEGSVYVLPQGTTVPTQAQRDAEAATLLEQGIVKGEAAAAAAKPTSTKNANGTTSYTVLNAASGTSDVMQFLPARINLNVGDAVTWNNPTEVPHTVTFLSGTALPDLTLPDMSTINSVAFFPNGAPSRSYDGTGYQNSGVISADAQLATGGQQFTMTFTKAGTYPYICLLHADQGMAGVIQVGNVTSTGSGTITAPNTGDAGLLDLTHSSSPMGLLGLLALPLLMVAGAGALVLRRVA